MPSLIFFLLLTAPHLLCFAQDAPDGNQQQDQSQTTPENKPAENPSSEKKPDENKDSNPNPAQAVADKTKELTAQAALATKGVAVQGFEELRDWQKGWFTGVYIEKGQPRIALTSDGRRDLYLRQTLITPGAYLKRAFAAGIDQARGTPYAWGGGLGGYSKRFASREGQFISANSIAALANAKLGYEPRYDQCLCQGFWPRTRHAIVRNFLTYDSTEQHLRPQTGLYLGSFSGGVISTAWKPDPKSVWANAGYAVLGQAGYGSLLNFFIEFANDINKKIGSKK